jgi:death-on-curing protein
VPDDDVLSELLGSLPISPAEWRIFARADSAATVDKVRLLSAAAIYFNAVAVRDFGGRAGAIRARGLVEQVVAAAFQTFEGTDPHPGPFDKAAMLLRGITQGHPFNDGNKRTGFLLTAYYLRLSGHPLPAHIPVDDVVSLCLRVSAGDIRDVAIITDDLERLWQAR